MAIAIVVLLMLHGVCSRLFHQMKVVLLLVVRRQVLVSSLDVLDARWYANCVEGGYGPIAPPQSQPFSSNPYSSLKVEEEEDGDDEDQTITYSGRPNCPK